MNKKAYQRNIEVLRLYKIHKAEEEKRNKEILDKLFKQALKKVFGEGFVNFLNAMGGMYNL